MMQPCPVYLQCHLFGDLARNQRHDATLSRLPAMSSLWRPCTGKTRGEPQSLCKMQAQTDADIRRLVLRRLLIALPRLSLGAVPPAKVHSAAGGRAAEGKGQWRGGGGKGQWRGVGWGGAGQGATAREGAATDRRPAAVSSDGKLFMQRETICAPTEYPTSAIRS